METVKASLAAMASSMTTISEKEILIDCPEGPTEGSPVSWGAVVSGALVVTAEVSTRIAKALT